MSAERGIAIVGETDIYDPIRKVVVFEDGQPDLEIGKINAENGVFTPPTLLEDIKKYPKPDETAQGWLDEVAKYPVDKKGFDEYRDKPKYP